MCAKRRKREAQKEIKDLKVLNVLKDLKVSKAAFQAVKGILLHCQRHPLAMRYLSFHDGALRYPHHC